MGNPPLLIRGIGNLDPVLSGLTGLAFRQRTPKVLAIKNDLTIAASGLSTRYGNTLLKAHMAQQFGPQAAKDYDGT